VTVDYILPASAIAPLLSRETASPLEGDVAMGETNHTDPQLPNHKTEIARMEGELGPPSGLTCPDCGGALWQVQAASLVRYRCHVGHAYSPDSLLDRHDDHVETALWTAVRALEERADLRKRMADQTATAGLALVSDAFAEQAQAAEHHADQIRSLLERSAAARPSIEEPREPRVHRKGRRQR
jgi:two-component system chemotaxis response regulator CheB